MSSTALVFCSKVIVHNTFVQARAPFIYTEICNFSIFKLIKSAQSILYTTFSQLKMFYSLMNVSQKVVLSVVHLNHANFVWLLKNNFKETLKNDFFIYRSAIRFIGVGYKLLFNFDNDSNLNYWTFNIGLSNSINFKIPFYLVQNNWVKIIKLQKYKNSFKISMNNLKLLTLFLSLIRRIKCPDSYKGKGIKFIKEYSKVKFRKKFGQF